jgi:hypothetical protein
MCRRLQKKGFSRVICCKDISAKSHALDDVDSQLCGNSFETGQAYDVVSLMNVLDRCHEPLQVRTRAALLTKCLYMMVVEESIMMTDAILESDLHAR